MKSSERTAVGMAASQLVRSKDFTYPTELGSAKCGKLSMRTRNPNQPQQFHCAVCKVSTIHKVLSRDKTVLMNVYPDGDSKRPIGVYKRIRTCESCGLNKKITIEILERAFNSTIKELQSSLAENSRLKTELATLRTFQKSVEDALCKSTVCQSNLCPTPIESC